MNEKQLDLFDDEELTGCLVQRAPRRSLMAQMRENDPFFAH